MKLNFWAKKDKTANKPITYPLSLVTMADRWSTYPSKGLTPEKLATCLREADGGNIYRQMELFEEMLEKDAHLFSLFQTRRLAVSGKNFEIIPASQETKDVEIAAEAAKMISRIRGWKNAINDILDSVPKGFSVMEIMWEANSHGIGIKKLKHLHQKKFRFGKVSDVYSDQEELRLIYEKRSSDSLTGIIPESELKNSQTDGIALDIDDRLRRKFVVNLCKARSGNPARTSILRTCTYAFLFKNYNIKWWVQFAEILLGYRIGKYDVNQPDQKRALEEALMGLSTDAAAVISNDSAIEFVEMAQKAASHNTYESLKDFCNEEMTKAVLAHVSATEGTPGKLGNETLTLEAIQRLFASDAEVLDETVTDDIIIPWVEYNYGRQDNYPYYKTQIEKGEDLSVVADMVIKVQQIGYPVSKKYVKEKFGIPPPDPQDPDDEVLTPQGTLNMFPSKQTVIGESKKKLLTRN